LGLTKRVGASGLAVVFVAAVLSAAAPASAASRATVPRTYHTGHVMLRHSALVAPSGLRNTSLLHNVRYFGGRVISHVKVYAVIWGTTGTFASTVTGSSYPSMSTFFAGITNSRYLDWMHEYNTTVTPVGGGSGTNQVIGRGTFGGLFTITPAARHNGSLVDDQNDIQPELDAQIQAGHLPAPDANTEYFLFFRQGQEITEGSMNSVTDFCAYHNTIGPVAGVPEVYYAVVPDLSGGGCGTEVSAFDDLTSTVSHELAESITDAEIGLASTFASPLGWYDQSEDEEISDICQGVGSGDGSVAGGDGHTYIAQLGWSDAQNACVADSGSIPAGTVPDPPTNVVATPGSGHVTVTWSAPGNNGGNTITDYRVTASPGGEVIDVDGTHTSATFTDLTLGSQYTFTVTATTGVGTGNASTPSNPVGSATVPGAPTSVSVAVGNALASVSWTAPASDGGSAILGYTVTPFIGSAAQTPVVFNDTSTTQTITHLSNGTKYSFRVAASNALGGGAASAASASVTPYFTSGMAIGDQHACAIDTMGHTVECWGANNDGQLGDGTKTSRSVPAAVSGLSGVHALALGGAHSCALMNGGAVECWGLGSSGQLGNGGTASSLSPVAVRGLTGATAISAGYLHTCALLASKTVECWGRNAFGQLGDHTTTSRRVPVHVAGLTNVVAISAGGDHTCALLTNHVVKCWGFNSSGQLGDGTATNRTTPVTVVGIASAYAISTRGAHTCAVLTDHTVRCWGLNSSGELGIGSTSGQRKPVAVRSLTGVHTIAAGDRNTCALLLNGTVDCWGANNYGQVGDNSTASDRLTPVPVKLARGIVTVSCGRFDAMERAANGALTMWGLNSMGQLGRGTTTARNPVAAKVKNLG